MHTKLILASGSQYRQAQLTSLGLVFESITSHIDETPLHDEKPEDLSLRLSKAKALEIQKNLSITAKNTNTLIIGCDQTADLNGMLLGKPGNNNNAIQQLTLCQNKTVNFYSGLCVMNTQTQQIKTCNVVTKVTFKPLSACDITRYVEHEKPFDCAGSFKVEGLGICLFESVQSDDPSALIGLPLIRTCQYLTQFGLNPLTHIHHQGQR